MAAYTATAALCLRAVQHALKEGWPAKNFPEHKPSVDRALAIFKKEQGREMLLKEASSYQGITTATRRTA